MALLLNLPALSTVNGATSNVDIFAQFDGIIDGLKVVASTASPNEGAPVHVPAVGISSKRKATSDPDTPPRDNVTESKRTEEEDVKTSKKLKGDDDDDVSSSAHETTVESLAHAIDASHLTTSHLTTCSVPYIVAATRGKSGVGRGFEYDRMSCLVDCMGTILECARDAWQEDVECSGIRRALSPASYAEKQESLYRLMRHNVGGSEYRHELKENPEEVICRGEPTHLRDVVRYLFRSQTCGDMARWHAQPTDQVYVAPAPVPSAEDDAYSCSGKCVARPFAVRSTFQCAGCHAHFSHPRAAVAVVCNHESALPFRQVLKNSLRNLQPMPKCPRRHEEPAHKHVVSFTDPPTHTFSDAVCLDFTGFEYARDIPHHEFPVAAHELAAGFFNANQTAHYSPIGFVYNVKDAADDKHKDPAHYVADVLVAPGSWMRYDDMRSPETARYQQPSLIHSPGAGDYALRNIALALYRRDAEPTKSPPTDSSTTQQVAPPPTQTTPDLPTPTLTTPDLPTPDLPTPDLPTPTLPSPVPASDTFLRPATLQTLTTSFLAPTVSAQQSAPSVPSSSLAASKPRAPPASLSSTAMHVSPLSAFRSLSVPPPPHSSSTLSGISLGATTSFAFAPHISTLLATETMTTTATSPGDSPFPPSLPPAPPRPAPDAGSNVVGDGAMQSGGVADVKSEKKAKPKPQRRALVSDGGNSREGSNGNGGGTEARGSVSGVGAGAGAGVGVGDDIEALKSADLAQWVERRERKRTDHVAAIMGRIKSRVADVTKSLHHEQTRLLDECVERNADFEHFKSQYEVEKAQRNLLMRAEMQKEEQIRQLNAAVAELTSKLRHTAERERAQQELHARDIASGERKYADMVRHYAEVIEKYGRDTEVFKNDCARKLQEKHQDVVTRDEYIADLESQLSLATPTAP